jgi:HSP20 family protein
MKSLIRFDPFRTDGFALAPFADLDRLVERAFGGLPVASTHAPAADLVETPEALELSVDLPGHDPASIKVDLEGDTLTIRSERKHQGEQKGEGYRRYERAFGTYARSFVLPGTFDPAATQARYVNGVLTVTVPKKEEAKPRSIEVKVK